MSHQFNSGMPPYPNPNPTPYPPYPNQPMFQAGYAQPVPNASPYPTPQFPGCNPDANNLPSQQGYGYQQASSSAPSYPNVNNMVPSFSTEPKNVNKKNYSEEDAGEEDYSEEDTGEEEYSEKDEGEEEYEGNPTVWEAEDFDPESDVKNLRKAFKKSNNNELIHIICQRPNKQRQIIRSLYKTFYGKCLVEDIRSNTKNQLKNLLVALLTTPEEFKADELHDATAKMGTDEDVLIEIICPSKNYEIEAINDAFEKKYKKNLEAVLMSETSGDFKRFMVASNNGNRNESADVDVDEDVAERDARELQKAGVDKFGTDESEFIMKFCYRNFNQIRLMAEKYQEIAGHSLDKALDKEFSGHLKHGLKTILKCAFSIPDYFAERLYTSMKGMGTNDKRLIRVIVTRCEVDMEDIKEAFMRLYGEDLRGWIKGDTSGDYRKALLTLIGVKD